MLGDWREEQGLVFYCERERGVEFLVWRELLARIVTFFLSFMTQEQLQSCFCMLYLVISLLQDTRFFRDEIRCQLPFCTKVLATVVNKSQR